MNYFDWTATSPVSEEALDEYVKISREITGNPSSTHPLGIKAAEKLVEYRKRIASCLECDVSDVYFTSGGTESDSIVIQSYLNNPSKGEIIVSGIEHSAILENKRIMESCGWKFTILKCPDGFLDPQDLKQALNPNVRLVCFMKVNNVTGSVLDTSKLTGVVREFEKTINRKIHIHCDAVQAFGKVPFSLKTEGFDSAAFSSHKLCGPRGIGVLFNSDKGIMSLSKGGGQEKGLRPGTENLPAIGAMTVAFEKAKENFNNNFNVVSNYRNHILSALVDNGIPVLSPVDESYSPYIITASFKGIPSEVFLRIMSDKGFCLSAGSACSSNSRGKAESVLTSMNINPEYRMSAIRISLSYLNTLEQVKNLTAALINTYKDFTNGK